MNLPKRFSRTSLLFSVRLFITCLVVSVISSAPAFAQKEQEFKPGDIVDVTHFRKTYRGIVTKVEKNAGWPHVKYIGIDEKHAKEDEMVLLEGEGFHPGAKVKFENFGKSLEGFILKVRSRSKHFGTRWTIGVLEEEEGSFTKDDVRLVRRPSEQVDPFESRGWTDSTGTKLSSWHVTVIRSNS